MRFQNESNKVAIELRVVQFWSEIILVISDLITCRAKLLNADWLRQRAFFLIKRALLVIKRASLLDADWLSTPALNWFPASNEF